MNKNQKSQKRAISAAAKAKQPSVKLSIPVGSNHKQVGQRTNVQVVERQVSVRRSADGEVSRNERRNSRMVVLHNKGEDGRCFSITRHVKIATDKPFRGRSRGERGAMLAELANINK